MTQLEPRRFSNFSDEDLEGKLFTEKLPILLSVLSNYGIYECQELTLIKVTSFEKSEVNVTISIKEVAPLFGFLIDEGFAIERVDIKPNAIELTDKGRW